MGLWQCPLGTTSNLGSNDGKGNGANKGIYIQISNQQHKSTKQQQNQASSLVFFIFQVPSPIEMGMTQTA